MRHTVIVHVRAWSLNHVVRLERQQANVMSLGLGLSDVEVGLLSRSTNQSRVDEVAALEPLNRSARGQRQNTVFDRPAARSQDIQSRAQLDVLAPNIPVVTMPYGSDYCNTPSGVRAAASADATNLIGAMFSYGSPLPEVVPRAHTRLPAQGSLALRSVRGVGELHRVTEGSRRELDATVAPMNEGHIVRTRRP